MRYECKRQRLLLLADGAAIFLVCAVLIGPLWRIEYLANWASIESTFIADARFLQAHWPHPFWLPLWYCGTRFDYIYPPALRYGTASLAMLFGVSTARAYHIYVALLYCMGGVSVYALVRAACSSRLCAWIAAAAAISLSPSFLFLPNFRQDSFLQMPLRLNVLLKWGEGPHVSALALLPLALAFSWCALRDRSRVSLVLAALFSALVVSNNFYGATALAILFPLLTWSLWITHRDRRALWRAAAIPALAYGLTAFWLTPSYLHITLRNLKVVSRPANPWAQAGALAAAILFAWITARFAGGRKDQAWRVFVCGAVLAFLPMVTLSYFFDVLVAGEPERLVPELDLVLILLAVEAVRSLAANRRWRQVAAAILVVAAFAAGWQYLSRPWSVFTADPNYASRVEYRLTGWVSGHLPAARVFATGSLRFWYNAWHDGAQVGGGSEQGLLNEQLETAQWQIAHDPAAGRDILWLQALGADAVAVHSQDSPEIYHEFVNPRKFAGHLPVLYDDGQGDILYQVPRRFPAHARLVDRRTAESLRPIPPTDHDRQELAAYVALLEAGPDRPVAMRWEGSDAIRLEASVNPGDAVIVQESYDPAWSAWSAGRRLTIHPDPAGYMRVDAPPGDREIRLRFEHPWDNTAGLVVTALTLLILAVLLFDSRRRAENRITI